VKSEGLPLFAPRAAIIDRNEALEGHFQKASD
jgi:hypothetical protein